MDRSHAAYGAQTRIRVGGTDVDIRVGGTQQDATPKGPTLDGDTRMATQKFARVKSANEMQMQQAVSSEGTFVKPQQVARQLHVREGMHVADFGAGSGEYIAPLARIVGTTGRVYAVEVQQTLLTRIQNEMVKGGFENVEVVWGNIEASEGTKIADETLDVVIISNTLFQVEDRIAVIKEAYRTLKPSGTLVLIDWSDSFGGVGPPKEVVVRRPEAVLLCTDNGFVLKRDFPAGEYHYGIVCTKSAAGSDAAARAAQAPTADDTDFIKRTIAQELV